MIRRFKTLHQLTQEELIAMKAPHALLLIDVDNTLLAPRSAKIDPVAQDWLKTMAKDHALLLCTNNFTQRQFKVGLDMNLPILMRSFKPFPFRVKAYLKKQGADLNSVIVVGDQVITDVLLAIWLKRPYVLIKPMDIDAHWITRWFRILESVVIKDE